jgi:hypothetical protein
MRVRDGRPLERRVGHDAHRRRRGVEASPPTLIDSD